MKKVVWFLTVFLLASSVFAGGQKESGTLKWPEKEITVICPWAVGGVADIVNRKMSTFGSKYFGVPVIATNELGAGGNIALTNYLKNEPNSYNLIFGGEGGFSIAPNIAGSEAIRFKYSDFEPIVNIYSAIFVMTANAKLNINNLDDLKAYGQGKKLKIAVNGAAGSEAFLVKALFKELGIEYELVSYNGANLALDAAAKGEALFAVSHQSQAKGNVEAGILKPIVVFNKDGVSNNVYNVRGVGSYGIKAYYPNTCCLFARKGTDPAVIGKIRDAYLKILQEPEVVELFKNLMIEANPMDKAEYDAHIQNVIDIVNANK
ncbi:tripartite tricarboxylate transporter substrate binding protein [Treponema parvum]|uniref:Tripartite tricarboxylate transporter substrate binding protein n=1 Tax=Treponema parvum TaxID=138851 RepID=A0A975F1I0_9SPIR|nr:tripartite tricarboxylate transporter substrate-binding protein [Treponema parvum]QTQ12638.1 tripartite tricarboxylate transporter substrate binding protein [Treponema parvum]